MKKIGIVVAQIKECEGLLKKLGKCELVDLYGGFSVRKFVVAGNEIYFAESGIGEIRATIATQRLIDEFHIETVINFGLAGGLKSGTRGNIYVLKGVCHYDFDTTPCDNAGRGKYDCFDSPVIYSDEALLNKVLKIKPTVSTAICASGDKFVAEEGFKTELTENFGATVCEMESAGVAIAAKLSGVPFIAIKIVSDDATHAEEYFSFLSAMTDELDSLILELIKNI